MLRYAADENFNNAIVWRLLRTHDVKTITRYAYERVVRGEHMPGVVEVSRLVQTGLAIDDLLLLAEASTADEWQGQILYLPLRQ